MSALLYFAENLGMKSQAAVESSCTISAITLFAPCLSADGAVLDFRLLEVDTQGQLWVPWIGDPVSSYRDASQLLQSWPNLGVLLQVWHSGTSARIQTMWRESNDAEARLEHTVARVGNHVYISTQSPQRSFGDLVVAAVHDVLYLYDVRLKTNVYMNRSLLDLLGHEPNPVQPPLGETFEEVVHPDDQREYREFAERMAKCNDDDAHEIVVRERDAHGLYRHIKSHVRVFERYADGSPRYLLCNLRDVTEHRVRAKRMQDQSVELLAARSELQSQKDELERVNRQLGRLAKTDGLTGLLNYREFSDRFRIELDRAERTESSLAFVMIDVDHFKNYNDTHGHVAGDAALVLFADILRSSVRAVDVVARYGGEEFCVLLPGANVAEATRCTKRAMEAIHNRFEKDRLMTASFGIAEWVHGMTAETLVKCADNALYVSKRAGRNRYTVFEIQQEAA